MNTIKPKTPNDFFDANQAKKKPKIEKFGLKKANLTTLENTRFAHGLAE